MATREVIDSFEFESRDEFDRATKEMEIIKALRERADFSDPKVLLKIYNKSVADKLFGTAVGYCFLFEIRNRIVESGIVSATALQDIPIKEQKSRPLDTIPTRLEGERKFQRLYEGQKLLNKKFKIAIIAMIIILAGFVFINLRFEYSIFTYFSDYKTNMEEELIDKYENWQQDLENREARLKNNQ